MLSWTRAQVPAAFVVQVTSTGWRPITMRAVTRAPATGVGPGADKVTGADTFHVPSPLSVTVAAPPAAVEVGGGAVVVVVGGGSVGVGDGVEVVGADPGGVEVVGAGTGFRT